MVLSRKNIISVVAVAAVLLIAAIPKLKFLQGGNSASGGGARSDTRIAVKAHVIAAKRLDDKYFTTGTLLANEEADLRSEVTGKVTRIYFTEGSRVKKGDLLVKINDTELQAELLRERYRKELADQKEERQRQLLKGSLISQETYDVVLNELNTVKAGVKLIQAQIEKTEIRAPFEGLIGLKYVSDGSYISPTTRVATLQNINPIKIDFSVPEKYAGEISRGAAISFKVQGSTKTFDATVYAIEPKIDQSTRTVQLRATSPNPAGELIPGAFAEIELVLRTIPEAMTIPAEALIPELSGHKVFLYRGGVVQGQPVQAGIRTSTAVQLTDGVQPGDTVITSGILQVRSGSPVQITAIE